MRLVLDDIRHAYGATQVLAGVSLEAPAGRIVCVVGPSGCGKSTLLRIAGGLERPDGGAALTEGDPPEGCLNPLTFVFQDFALLPWRSVSGNVALPLEARGLRRAERREIISDALARTKLSDFADAFPRQLSGGMRQRVAIARALAVRPAIWLMDEPLSALDAQTRALLMDDLAGLWGRQPFSALYVTHNLREAVRLGHRIAVLSRRPGTLREIVEIDRPLEGRDPSDPELHEIERHIWALIRDEARAAEEEVAA